MKDTYFIWLVAGLLSLPGVALAQASRLAPAALPVASGGRAVLGGPPQLAAEPADTTSLHQLLLQLEQAATGPPATHDARLELSLQAARQLAQQLAATQQQLAELRHQLAATRQLAGELLLDHAQLADLRQQLSQLLNRQAAAISEVRQRRIIGWPAE